MLAATDLKISSKSSGLCCRTSTAALLLSLLLSSESAAQNYKTITANPTDRQAKAVHTQIIAPSLRDQQTFTQNKDKFDAYFKKYYFPRMTYSGQLDLSGLAKRSDNLFKQYIRKTSVKEIQEHLTGLTMSAMGNIALGNFHPAVRYNAVLIIGKLDKEYSNGSQPPVPLPAGTRVLLILLEKDSFKKIRIPASLKLGALKGLERHARFGIEDEYTKPLTQALLKLMAQEEPAEGVDRDVHNWIQCQAVRVLVRQFEKGPTPEVQTALTAMISNGEINLDERCCAAGLLKRMEYNGVQGIDTTAARLALGNLTQAVFKEERTFAKDFTEEIVKGQNFSRRGGGGLGRSRGEDLGPQYERRRVMARVKGIQDGANAISVALPEEEKQQLQELIARFDSLMELGGKEKSDDIIVARSVLKLVREIDQVVASWNASEEPADEPEEEDFS